MKEKGEGRREIGWAYPLHLCALQTCSESTVLREMGKRRRNTAAESPLAKLKAASLSLSNAPPMTAPSSNAATSHSVALVLAKRLVWQLLVPLLLGYFCCMVVATAYARYSSHPAAAAGLAGA